MKPIKFKPTGISETHEGRVGNCPNCAVLLSEFPVMDKCPECYVGIMWDDENLFLNTRRYGKLYMEELFLYYEEPLLFTCKTADGSLYLLNCLTLQEYMREYMIVPVTENRIEDMKARRVDLRTMFVEQEEFAVALVARDGFKLVGNRPVELVDATLPDKDVYL